MSEVDHVSYFRQRAADERELAANSPAPYIAHIHTQMAEHYEALSDSPDDRHVLRIVAESPWTSPAMR